ncbi:MAG: alpha/beta hydrolase fold domain-containing protein [Lautropia sp.]
MTETMSAEMQAVMARIAALRAGQPDRYGLPFAESRLQLLRERRWWLEDGPAMARVSDRFITAGTRTVRLRCYQPPAPDPDRAGPIVYLHGGGWCVGSVDTHDAVIRHLARACRRAAIGIDYALAPEAPFPAALEDVDAALEHLAAEGTLAPDWVLAGDSAGAHLALLATLAARERPPAATGGWRLPSALLLFYGVYFPLRPTSSLQRFGGGDYGLSLAALQRYQSAFLGGLTPEQAPGAFVARERLQQAPASGPEHGSGRTSLPPLPPAWLAAAGLDPLLDDSIELARALADAGSHHQLRVYPAVIHGFLSYTRMLGTARAAFEDAGAFLRDCSSPAR